MLLGAAALGVYTVAKRIALMLLGGFGGAINAVALPSFARVQHDRERMRRATTEGLRLTSAVIFPAMIGLAAISPEAIPALFGSQWKDATTPGVIIALAGIMSVFPTVLHSAYHGLGRPGIPLRLNVVRAIGALIFVPLLAPWGLTGIAAAYLVRDALAAGADMYPMKRLLKVRYMMIAEALAPIAMASTLMAFIVRVVASLTPLVPAIWQLLTMIATGALVYGAVVAIADRPTFRFFRETITTRVSRASRRQKSTA
jgi:PST family polysaccharide transporter